MGKKAQVRREKRAKGIASANENSLETMLHKCSLPTPPDHYSFRLWFLGNQEKKCWDALLDKASAKIVALNKTGKSDEFELKKFKLLYEALEGVYREGVLNALLNPIDLGRAQDLNELRKLDPARLREAIFKNIENISIENNISEAISISCCLGLLTENKLDEGELDYLQGCLYEAVKIYEKAVIHYANLKPSAIDFRKSRFLLARGLIHSGKLDQLRDVFEDIKPYISPSERHIIVQILAANFTEEIISASIGNKKTLLAKKPSPDDLRYADYVANTLRLFSDFVDTIEAFNVQNRGGTAPNGQLDERGRRLRSALDLTTNFPAIIEKYDSEWADHFSDELVDMALTCHQDPILALEYHRFIINGYSRYHNKNTRKALIEFNWRLFEGFCSQIPGAGRSLAYEYRNLLLAEKSPLQFPCDDLIKKLYPQDESVRAPDYLLPNMRFYNFLDTESLSFYKSACEQLKYIWSKSDILADHGMVTIGLFRIVEREFREKFILPILSRLSEPSINEIYVYSLGKAESKFFYKKTANALQKIIKWREQRTDLFLDLGEIRSILDLLRMFLANKMGKTTTLLLADLSGALDSCLSQEGIDKLTSGALASLITQEVLDRFRNPPAHARYVDISTALECKIYIDKVISILCDSILAMDR